MDKEAKLNTAIALWLAEQVIPMNEPTRWVLTAALAALLARMVWQWVRPTWARYPATVGALAVLVLLILSQASHAHSAWQGARSVIITSGVPTPSMRKEIKMNEPQE